MTNLFMMDENEMKQNDRDFGMQYDNFEEANARCRRRKNMESHIMMAIVEHDGFEQHFGSKVIISKVPEAFKYEKSGYYTMTWTGDYVTDECDGMSESGQDIIENMIDYCEKYPELNDLKSFLHTAIEKCCNF